MTSSIRFASGIAASALPPVRVRGGFAAIPTVDTMTRIEMVAVKTGASPWAKVRDRAAEREEKREAVLHAAAEAFSANGYHRTSLDDIAVRLGITKPTLYYYAKNKEDLIGAVTARALEQMLVHMHGDPRATAFQQLTVFLRNYAIVAANDFGRCLIQLADSDLSPAAGAHVKEGKAAIDKKIRGLIVAGIADGSIADCDPKLTAFMLAGAVNGISRWYRAGAGLPPEAVADIYVNQLSTGLLPRS